MNPFRLLTSCAFGVALAAAVSSPATSAECFLQRNINGFSAPNDRTLYVRVGLATSGGWT